MNEPMRSVDQRGADPRTAVPGSLAANLPLGVLWSGWHLPLWFIPGTFQSTQSFPLYLVGVTALSLILGWIHNGTGASLLLVVLAHSASDAGDNLRSNLLGAIAADQASEYHVIGTALTVAVALLVLVASRDRLAGKRRSLAVASQASSFVDGAAGGSA